MKKKVSVKKTVKKSVKKNVMGKKIKKISAPIIKTVNRNFWELFSKVKNHNFHLMMQKGNYLPDFIKLVEEMPEEQFQTIFIQSLVSDTTASECYCPISGQCFCESSVPKPRLNNNDFEYLKKCRLDQYYVEIQHLRYLIKLQDKGHSVPVSYPFEEFSRRSGFPVDKSVLVNSAHFASKTSLGVKENIIVDDSIKMTQSPVDFSPEESKKALETAKARKFEEIVNSIKNESTAMQKLDIATLSGKYEDKVPSDSISLGNSLEKKEESRPSLKSLLVNKIFREEIAKQKNEEFKKFENESPSLSKVDLDEIVRQKNEEIKIALKEKDDGGSLKKALQTLVKYSEVLETSSAPTEQKELPKFWQELKAARKVVDEFDSFYARKYCDYISACKRSQQEEEKILTNKNDDSTFHLIQNIKTQLKAKRELEVLKKILHSAYEEFHKSEVIQIDAEYLKTEASKYANKSHEFTELFGHLGPNKGAYERAMAKRTAKLSPFTSKRNISDGAKIEKKPILITLPYLETEEGRASYRKNMIAKAEKFNEESSEDQQVNPLKEVIDKYRTLKSFEEDENVLNETKEGLGLTKSGKADLEELLKTYYDKI